jgi:putative glycosyltransferase (TIGR04372 family)
MKSKIKHLLSFFFGFPVVLFMKLISPIILVRVGSIKDRALGNFCFDVDINQFIISQETKDVRVLNLWYFEGPYSSNKILTNLVKRNLTILPKFILAPIKKIAFTNKKFSKHLAPYYDTITGKIMPVSEVPNIKFWCDFYSTGGLSQWLDTGTKGIKTLKEKLEANSKEIVCMHIRDSEYKKHQGLRRGLNESQLNYYAARSSFRDSDIINYVNSAAYLDECGYRVIRLGSKVKSITQLDLGSIYNYAESDLQNPYNDIALVNTSKFVICGFSGIYELAGALRKPIFAIDIADFTEFSRRPGIITETVIILPKVIKAKSSGRVLTIDELDQLKITSFDAHTFREFINSNKCPVFLESNDPKAILNTIKLGEKYVTTRTISDDVAAGKTHYQKLYSFSDFDLAPILSPYWANLHLKV